MTIWGGAFNTENFRAGFEAVPYRYREAGAALGFGRLATFLNVTLPIGGRIALPSSINTYISVLKNTSLMYVIGYAELTTTSTQHQQPDAADDRVADGARLRLPLPRLGAVGADPAARVPARSSGDALMSTSARRAISASCSHWRAAQSSSTPGARSKTPTGPSRSSTTSSSTACRGRSSVSAAAVVGSALIGVTLGTVLTIKFLPLQALIRLYIEVFRGLPILVTVFIVYFGLPSVSPGLEFGPLLATSIALILWGSAQVAEATRGAVQSIPREQHEAASALGFGWVGRHGFVILPQALRRLLPPFVSLLVNIIQNSTLAQVIGGLELLEAAERQNERITAIPPIGLGEIKAFQIFGFVMVLFFLLSFPLTRLAARLEKRLV